jgi:hypothetical protein
MDKQRHSKGIQVFQDLLSKNYPNQINFDPSNRKDWHEALIFDGPSLAHVKLAIGSGKSYSFCVEFLEKEINDVKVEFLRTEKFDISSIKGVDWGYINDRIKELRTIASDEGADFSEESVNRSIVLLGLLKFKFKPSIFVSGNGNIRLVWENKKKERVALQVRAAENKVQYVILRDGGRDALDQIFGVMSFEGIVHFLDEIGLSAKLMGWDFDGQNSSFGRTSSSLRRRITLQS